jgi:protein SCO1
MRSEIHAVWRGIAAAAVRPTCIGVLCFFALAQMVFASGIDWPNAALLDQNGAKTDFRTLVQNRVVVIDTVFTSCTMSCPLLGAKFAKLSRLLADSDGRNVLLISITNDWQTDTPERLRDWAAKFGPSRNWTLLTGSAGEVTRVLKALDLYVADKNTHSSRLLLFNNVTGERTQIEGGASPENVAAVLIPMARKAARIEHASNYFGNENLVDQNGRQFHFYDDLLREKVVVIDTFFATCQGSCPRMSAVFMALQDWLGDRLGRDVELISITVDPVNDTPPVLKDYASRFHARPGWHLMTGDPDTVTDVLKRLGEYTQNKQDHLNVFLIGNERTGLWKKAFGLSPPDDLKKVLISVMSDGT